MSKEREAFKRGVKGGIPIALGYLAVSFSIGLTATKCGLNVFEAAFMSLTNVTSAGQFSGLNIIAAGGGFLEIALNQFLINLRYALMSFSIAQKLSNKYNFMHRLFVAFGMTDEIYAISAMEEGKLCPFFNYGAMSVAIPGWVVGTIVGALAGAYLPTMIISALGLAIYGMFIAIIIPPAKKNKFLFIVILCAMALSAAFKYIPFLSNVSSGFVVIIVTVVVSLGAAIIRPVEEDAK